MSDEDVKRLKEIFSVRLANLLSENNMSQTELASMLGVSESTVGKWLLKKSFPRMSILEKLSVIFNRPKAYFYDEEEQRSTYYLNPETAQLAQELHDHPELRILMDASKKLSPEDIRFVMDLVNRMKKD
mgnify:CR=1 FL=1